MKHWMKKNSMNGCLVGALITWWLKKKNDDDFESILLYEILVDIVNETTAGFPAVHHPRQAEPLLLLLLFLFLLLLLLS